MKLKGVSRIFDKTVAYDAYGTSSFMCQLEPLTLFKIDGVSVRKRALSCAPEIQMPDRGVIMIDDEPYLVGTGVPDFWFGKVIRRNYVIQGADGLAKLTTIAAQLSGILPTQAYAALVFNRYLPDNVDSSKYPPQYQIFLAGGESVGANSLVAFGNDWYLVKESYTSNSGLLISLANMLEAPLFENVSYGAQTYDPITDTYTGTASSVRIMRVNWQEHFQYLTASSTDYVRGDMQVFVLKSAVPNLKPSDVLTLSDGAWRVLSAIAEGSLWSVHVRKS